MKILGQFWWYIKCLLFGLLGVILLYILVVFIGFVWVINLIVKKCDYYLYEVFVIINGIYFDIVILLIYLLEQFIYLSYFYDSIIYVVFGWGECDFYFIMFIWEDFIIGVVV